MSRIGTEAESLAVALELGFIPVSHAVAWADARIAASDVPHVALCDVSMASGRFSQDVVSILRRLPGEVDNDAAVRGALRAGLARFRSQKLEATVLAKGIFTLAVADNLPDGEFKSYAYGFWDAIDLARDGIGGGCETTIVRDMERRIAAFVGNGDG